MPNKRQKKSQSSSVVPPTETEIISSIIEKLGIESPISVAFSPLPKGWRSYISFVAQSAKEGDKDMIRYMQVYDSLSEPDRLHTTPETIADLANVKLEDLLASVVKMTFRYCRVRSSLATAMSEPRVIEDTAKFSRSKDGTRDRELLLKVSGALPQPNKTTNIFSGTYNATPAAPNILEPASSDIEEFDALDDHTDSEA